MNPKGIFVLVVSLAISVSIASFVPALAQSDLPDTLSPKGHGDNFGHAVSDAGDVNGDGKADIIVGAHKAGYDLGKAFIISGATGQFIYVFNGKQYGEGFGYSVSGAGDVDGDGRSDVIVGAPYYYPGGVGSTGRVIVFSGLNGDSIWTFYGDSIYYAFGYSVSGGGDVDGDGRGDLVVGSPRYLSSGIGKAFVFSGMTGDTLHAFERYSGAHGFGISVAGAGDVDDDGRDDVVIGDPYNDSAYVFSGRDGSMLWSFGGHGEFGRSVSGAGDVDGDGHADVIVGAPMADTLGLTDCGKAHVFSGDSGKVIWEWHGDSSYDHFGNSVSGAGDVDVIKDGRADLIVGAPDADSAGLTDVGKAYVFSGRTGQIICEFYGGYEGPRGDGLGESVSGAGDVNLDGKDDVIGLGKGRCLFRSFVQHVVYFLFPSPRAYSSKRS